MDLKLKDKVALATGGSRGIGRAICITLASVWLIPAAMAAVLFVFFLIGFHDRMRVTEEGK